MEEKTATAETSAHYRNKTVMQTILRCSNINGLSRWFVGDKTGWYSKANRQLIANNAIEARYRKMVGQYRTLHYTLSYFDSEAFNRVYTTKEDKAEGKEASKSAVRAYTFGIDIDTIDLENGHGANIHEPAVKESVEAMASFFVGKLKEICPNSIHCLYSGGGIYVMVHHSVFESWFTDYDNMSSDERAAKTDMLKDALNRVIADWQNEFKAVYPDKALYAKADAINGAKRVFKSIFSIHKKHPYAVIPINPDNIKIDFESARFPLSDEVLESGKSWYTTFDTDNGFLDFLTPYIETQKEVAQKRKTFTSGDLLISEIPFVNVAEYPPCIRKILSLTECGAGATRALGVLAAFLGQVGVEEDQAKQIWYGLANKWHAAAAQSNVFESCFRKIHCPSCRTLRKEGPGYPHLDLTSIEGCKPDQKCALKIRFTNPVYYTDKMQYCKYLQR